MTRLSKLLPSLLALALAAPAVAAPTPVTATLRIDVRGLAPVSVSNPGTIDITAGVLTVPAGLVSLPGTLVVPVTGVSSVTSLSVTGVGNLAGTFSVGGVTAQAPGEVCPGGLAPAGTLGGLACNVGGGLGGVMGLTGNIEVPIVPGVVVIPLNLAALKIGLGGSQTAPFLVDAAAWSAGSGLLNTGVNTLTTHGSTAPGFFQLVTPTFVVSGGNTLPIFSSFTLQVPEPVAGLLIASALVGAVWWGRSLRR